MNEIIFGLVLGISVGWLLFSAIELFMAYRKKRKADRKAIRGWDTFMFRLEILTRCSMIGSIEGQPSFEELVGKYHQRYSLQFMAESGRPLTLEEWFAPDEVAYLRSVTL